MTSSAGAGGNLPPNKMAGLNASQGVNGAQNSEQNGVESQSPTAKKTSVNKDASLYPAGLAEATMAAVSPQVGKPVKINDIIAQAIANPKLSGGVTEGLKSAGSNYAGETEFPEELADAGFSQNAMKAFMSLGAQQA